MALANYTDLQASVAAWVNRTDLTAYMPDFVALAESDIRGDLRAQFMESTTSGTLTGETLDHPARYIEARRLTVGGKSYYYRTPEVYQAASDAGAVARIFTSIGQSFYILGGASGDAYTLTYRAGIAPLASVSTNWLLTNAPDVYLWGTCKQAALFLKDAAAEATFDGRYQAAVMRVNDREKKAAHSGSALQIAPATTE